MPTVSRRHEDPVKVQVDQHLCTGYNLCIRAAPELFETDDWGIASVVPGFENVSSEMEEKAREAARRCPVSAIVVEEDQP
jgi:ferredoxin